MIRWTETLLVSYLRGLMGVLIGHTNVRNEACLSIIRDSRKNETKIRKGDIMEITKRDVNIIGPIPTSYRGQATGQTTFDGILADDLLLPLPATDLEQYQPQGAPAPRFSQLGSRSSAVSPTFQLFQAESRPDVYNFDGKEKLTYDGILASDLMVPYAHFTVLNQQARSAQSQPQYFRQRVPQTTAQQPTFQQFQSQPFQPVDRQANFPDSFRDDRTLPSSAPFQFQAFQQTGTVPTNAGLSQFQPETPTERYNRLQQQYEAALAEYRNALLRFQEQLKKYSSFSRKK